MNSLGSLLLGYDREQQLTNAKGVLARGFPDGMVVFCKYCNRIFELDKDQAAASLLDGWPRCCRGKRMTLTDRDLIPF